MTKFIHVLMILAVLLFLGFWINTGVYMISHSCSGMDIGDMIDCHRERQYRLALSMLAQIPILVVLLISKFLPPAKGAGDKTVPVEGEKP